MAWRSKNSPSISDLNWRGLSILDSIFCVDFLLFFAIYFKNSFVTFYFPIMLMLSKRGFQ